jgi:hypothetical protein
MAVAKKKPAETEGAKVPAAVDTMPDILLYVEKKVPRMKGFALRSFRIKKVVPWTKVDIRQWILFVIVILVVLLLENHRVLDPGDQLVLLVCVF